MSDDGLLDEVERAEKGVEGAHSRRRGAEHFDASYRSSPPLSEETKDA